MTPRPTSSPGPILVCADCRGEMQSQSHHDFVSCSCGNSFVDGGSQYTRVGFKTKPPMTRWEAKQLAAMEAMDLREGDE